MAYHTSDQTMFSNWTPSRLEYELPISQQRQVYRVVTYISAPNGHRKIDPGPWLKSQNEAEYWADYLRTIGYRFEIEKLRGDITRNYQR